MEDHQVNSITHAVNIHLVAGVWRWDTKRRHDITAGQVWSVCRSVHRDVVVLHRSHSVQRRTAWNHSTDRRRLAVHLDTDRQTDTERYTDRHTQRDTDRQTNTVCDTELSITRHVTQVTCGVFMRYVDTVTPVWFSLTKTETKTKNNKN